MDKRITIPVLISVLAGALTLGYIMVTQAEEDIQQITVCVNNSCLLRLKREPFGNCKKNETELSWNKEGQSTKQPHMFDAYGQDLGIAMGHQIVFNPDLKLFFGAVNMSRNARTDNKIAKFLPLETDIFFEQKDCAGTPFFDSLFSQPQYVIAQYISGVGFTGTPPFPFFKINFANSPIGRTALSRLRDFEGCGNISPEGFDSTLQLEEITLPFTLPLAWPLHVDMK
jgi:hypothetical protein